MGIREQGVPRTLELLFGGSPNGTGFVVLGSLETEQNPDLVRYEKWASLEAKGFRGTWVSQPRTRRPGDLDWKVDRYLGWGFFFRYLGTFNG